MYSSKEHNEKVISIQRRTLEKVASKHGVSFELVKNIAKSQSKSIALGIKKNVPIIKVQYIGKFIKRISKTKKEDEAN